MPPQIGGSEQPGLESPTLGDIITAVSRTVLHSPEDKIEIIAHALVEGSSDRRWAAAGCRTPYREDVERQATELAARRT